MIKLALYGYGFYWLFTKMGMMGTKQLKGYGEVHHPFEHPMGDSNCNECQMHGEE